MTITSLGIIQKPVTVTYKKVIRLKSIAVWFVSRFTGMKRRQFQHEVAVKIEWHFKQNLLTQPQKWRDCDNGVKCLLDALTEAKVWVDDKIVYRFSGIERFFDSESENYCVVRITGE